VLLIGQENESSYLSLLEVPPCETMLPPLLWILTSVGGIVKPPSLV